jgi:prepilin-type N-terminal cleavage/methylation domain-containing protein
LSSTSKTDKRDGFTLLEVLVAVAISLIVTGAAVVMFSETEKFRRQAEKRMRYMAQWQSFQALFEREMRGLFDYRGGDLTVFEIVDNPPPQPDRITFVAAVDNMLDEAPKDSAGDADFIEVTYYMSAVKGGLCRKVRAPGQALVTDDDKWLAFPDVRAFGVSTEPDPLPSGELPSSVTVMLYFADPLDPLNPAVNQIWSTTFYVTTKAP